jgi:hypothetical protein
MSTHPRIDSITDYDTLYYEQPPTASPPRGARTGQNNLNTSHGHLQEPGFDQSYPFSPYDATAPTSWQAGPISDIPYFESPEHSPQLRPVRPASPPTQRGLNDTYNNRTSDTPQTPRHREAVGEAASYYNDIVSPLSPPARYNVSPPRRGDSEVGLLRGMSAADRWSYVKDDDRGNMVKQESGYDIPAAPPPPKVPLDFAEPYERNRGMGDPERGGSQRVMRRSGTLAHRLGSRIMGSVRRSRTSARWRSSRIEQDEDYRKVDEQEEAIGFDVSTFGPEFAVPSEARKAMEEHQFEDMAYTGTGEVYDLSNLTGFDTPMTGECMDSLWGIGSA